MARFRKLNETYFNGEKIFNFGGLVPEVFVPDPPFPSPTPTPSITPSPTATPVTPTPTPSITSSPTPTPSITSSVTPTPTITSSPTATPTTTPTNTPTITPTITLTPTQTLTPTPSSTPLPPEPVEDFWIYAATTSDNSADYPNGLYSNSAESWTGYTTNAEQPKRLNSAVYNNGLFVVTTDANTTTFDAVRYSYDGIDFSASSSKVGQRGLKIIYVDYLEQFMFVGTQRISGFTASNDDVIAGNWTSFIQPINDGSVNIFKDLTNNQVIMTDRFGGIYTMDNDFNTWTLQDGSLTGITSGIHNIVFGKSYVFKTLSDTLYDSVDNINWSSSTRNDVGLISRNAVSYRDTDGRMLLVGSTGGTITDDGINWSATTLPVTTSGGTWITSYYADGADLFIIGANDGSLATSPDGLDWTIRTNPKGYDGEYGMRDFAHKYPRTISTESYLEILTENNDEITTQN
jgi:hypothetical protein